MFNAFYACAQIVQNLKGYQVLAEYRKLFCVGVVLEPQGSYVLHGVKVHVVFLSVVQLISWGIFSHIMSMYKLLLLPFSLIEQKVSFIMSSRKQILPAASTKYVVQNSVITYLNWLWIDSLFFVHCQQVGGQYCWCKQSMYLQHKYHNCLVLHLMTIGHFT